MVQLASERNGEGVFRGEEEDMKVWSQLFDVTHVITRISKNLTMETGMTKLVTVWTTLMTHLP